MSQEYETPGANGSAADLRRDAMLRAALEVIAERGFPETRIADVAEQAGTSPALVIYYFTTKDNLLTEAMRLAEDLWYDLGARRMEVIDSAAGRLEEIVAMTCLPEADAELPDSWALWLDLWAQSVRHPEVARVREEFDAHWRETITDIVARRPVVGRIRRVRRRRVRHHAVGAARRSGRADRSQRPGRRSPPGVRGVHAICLPDPRLPVEAEEGTPALRSRATVSAVTDGRDGTRPWPGLSVGVQKTGRQEE